MRQNNNVVIQFQDWQIDIFPTEFGKLGLTVERVAPKGEFQEDQPCVDIFVDPRNLKVVSDGRYQIL